MKRPQGYAFLTDKESGKIVGERDTYTCSHCHKVVHVVPMCDPADLGGFCSLCDKLICASCAYLMSLGKPCIPFLERIQRLDNRLEKGMPYMDPMSEDI